MTSSRGEPFEGFPSFRSGQVRSGQVRSGQVRSGQVRSGQVRSGQVRSGQVRSGQVRSGQVRSGQVRSGQVRSGQVRSGPRGEAKLLLGASPGWRIGEALTGSAGGLRRNKIAVADQIEQGGDNLHE
ncbi:hypothetical protein Zmor_024846 [Zophobas morio]|uniref:Uncharacterized protein n=1 Tax=Zophobas morio TaxID=2755281 RepID=A0AA38HQI0_9CUCU|nr:hypothetical protein Zmor_024846 [Zophobas morio]